MTAKERLADPLLQAMIESVAERAAEEGARKALAKLGLHDEDAAEDMRELRGLLEGWRDAKKAVLQTVMRSLTTMLLGALAAGLAVKYLRD